MNDYFVHIFVRYFFIGCIHVFISAERNKKYFIIAKLKIKIVLLSKDKILYIFKETQTSYYYYQNLIYQKSCIA